MGNRAVITMQNTEGLKHPVALYVHWHGGLESVLAFMTYTWNTFERGRDDVFTFHARLCQVIGNFFAEGLSLYGYALEQADEVASGCDNGLFHFTVGPKGIELHGMAEACMAARQHTYWTGEHTIFQSIERAMPQQEVVA